MTTDSLKLIVESVLMGHQEPISIKRLLELFKSSQMSVKYADIEKTLEELKEDYEGRGIELTEVASGFRIQVRKEYASWLYQLSPEKPERYSQALLETLALIVYRQPITRGEIEQIRGVAVSTPIMRTLKERRWVRVLGHKNVPGKPALYGTTITFLNDFNVSNLNQLPKLKEFEETPIESPQAEFDLIGEPDEQEKPKEIESDNTFSNEEDSTFEAKGSENKTGRTSQESDSPTCQEEAQANAYEWPADENEDKAELNQATSLFEVAD